MRPSTAIFRESAVRDSQVKEASRKVEHQDGSKMSDSLMVVDTRGILDMCSFLFIPQGNRPLLQATVSGHQVQDIYS